MLQMGLNLYCVVNVNPMLAPNQPTKQSGPLMGAGEHLLTMESWWVWNIKLFGVYNEILWESNCFYINNWLFLKMWRKNPECWNEY